jgi:hypothetical protein
VKHGPGGGTSRGAAGRSSSARSTSGRPPVAGRAPRRCGGRARMLGRRRERPDGRQTCRGRRRCSRSGRPSFSPCWSSFDIHRRRLERWDGRKLRQAGLGRVEVRVREGALRLLLGKGRPGTRPRPCSETLCRGRPAASRMWRSLGHHHDEYHPTVLDPPRLIHDDSSSDTGRAPAMLARGQGRRKASCRPQPRGSSRPG